MRARKIQLLICFMLLLIFACTKGDNFEQYKPIKNHNWAWADVKSFDVLIDDTAARYNLYIDVRHHQLFDWRNLWLETETIYPDSTSKFSKVNLPIADAAGNYYGNCAGDLCDLQVKIQENAIFPKKGKYVIRIGQNMRLSPLENIFAIGLRVEKNTNTKR